MQDSRSEIEASYDRVAEDYAAEFLRVLNRKPFDREILDRFAEASRGEGMFCEIGCGPGHIARYLQDRGVEMRGIDLSSEMVKQASLFHPEIPFERGDMLDLSIEPDSLSGIVCFFAIIHLRRDDVPRALSSMHAALHPGGRLLLSFHGGSGTLHREELFGKPVSIDITLFESVEMRQFLEESGFEVEEILEREPYEFEYQTRRIFASARKR